MLIVIGIFARCVRTVNVISRLNYYTHYSCLTIPNTVSVVLDILQFIMILGCHTILSMVLKLSKLFFDYAVGRG